VKERDPYLLEVADPTGTLAAMGLATVEIAELIPETTQNGSAGIGDDAKTKADPPVGAETVVDQKPDFPSTRELKEKVLRSVVDNISRKKRGTLSARELIQYSKDHPPEAIIEGLLNVGDTLLLHGTEESYKSVFILQIAESICTGRSLLRHYKVRGTRRVGIIETEMHPAMLGQRLANMFADGSAPENMCFLDEMQLKEWRRCDMDEKVRVIGNWIIDQNIQVLMIDTANDFFRGEDNPSEERSVGGFFDQMRNLPACARIFVRHDRKKKDIDGEAHSNELIRGSAEWKEDPEAILYLKRKDKRTHEVEMEVGKLRYGKKPEPFQLWFDLSCFRLLPLPPVIAALEDGKRSRQEIIAECKRRFGVEARLADSMIEAYRPFLREEQQGHNRIFELHAEHCLEALWAGFLTYPKV
jgi:hypothetical protein